MPNTEVIDRRACEAEVGRSSRIIDRLNGALAAYPVMAEPMHTHGGAERAVPLAAKMGRVSNDQAAESVRRVQHAVILPIHAV